MLVILDQYHLNVKSLPNAKILDMSKLKVFPDNNFCVTSMMKFVVLPGKECIMGKGKNAGYQKLSPKSP